MTKDLNLSIKLTEGLKLIYGEGLKVLLIQEHTHQDNMGKIKKVNQLITVSNYKLNKN